ncbi:MAG: DNA polymerase III subunit delta [Clostridiales bacterium]|nr:DNA polymerase III subunit delta [Clostridiales bacterium]
MILSGEKELNKQIKAGLPTGVYLLYGSDRSLVERYCTLLADRAVTGERAFNYERIDGSRIDLDRLYDSVLTLPMLSERRCVVLDDPDIDKLSSGDFEKLKTVLGEVDESTVLIIAVKQNEFLPKKSQKCKKLLELAGKLGTAVELGERSTGDLVKTVMKQCADRGCSISRENAELLVQRTTGELLAVQNETDKLIAFTGSGEVSRESVLRLVSATVEAEVFSLSKSILSRDYARAMQILSALLYLREPAVNILYVLSMSFVDLYRAKVAAFADADAAQVAAAFGYRGRDFAVKNAFRDSRKLPLRFLKRSLEVFARADSELKSSGGDEKVILQRAVTEVFMLLGEEAG